MKLKNVLIVVSDMEKSKTFYKKLFGLSVVTDFGENVILSEGLVLQEKKLWEKFIHKEARMGGNNGELYFEENCLDEFLDKLKRSVFQIRYVNPLMEHDWGQRVIRIYDPDDHIIEIGESLEFVARRLRNEGMSPEEISQKTGLPMAQIDGIIVSGEVH